GVALSIFILYYFFADAVFKNFVEGRINSKSGSIRMETYRTIIHSYFNLNVLQQLVGAGSGSAAMALTGIEGVVHTGSGGYFRYYPHNIILVILYEYGIIGLILFFKACISPFLLTFRKIKKNPDTVFLMGFWVFWFFNSLLSTDIMGNFLLFGLS